MIWFYRLEVVLYVAPLLLAICLTRFQIGLPVFWWAFTQWVQLNFTLIGWFLLIPFCLLHLWSKPKYASIKTSVPVRYVDYWLGGWWNPLNWFYNNREDGVSGDQALIWKGTPPVLVSYMDIPSWWPAFLDWLWNSIRAYCWSALRNSADQVKYWFQYSRGQKLTGTWLGGRQWKIGWQLENNRNVPVFSL